MDSINMFLSELITTIWSKVSIKEFSDLPPLISSLTVLASTHPKLVQSTIGDDLISFVTKHLLPVAAECDDKKDVTIIAGMHLMTEYIIALTNSSKDYQIGKMFLTKCLAQMIQIYDTPAWLFNSQILVGVVECFVDLLCIGHYADMIPGVIFFHLGLLVRMHDEDLRKSILSYISERICDSKLPHYFTSLLSLTICDPDKVMRTLVKSRVQKVISMTREKNATYRKFGMHVHTKQEPEFSLTYLIYLLSNEDEIKSATSRKDHERIITSFVEALIRTASDHTVDLIRQITEKLRPMFVAGKDEQSHVQFCCDIVDKVVKSKTSAKNSKIKIGSMQVYNVPIIIEEKFFTLESSSGEKRNLENGEEPESKRQKF